MHEPALGMQISEHSAPGVQPDASAAPETRMRWDDLKLFLDVSELLSFRAAGDRNRLSVNTVRARMSRLEEDRGELLLIRGQNGVKLTDSGRKLRLATLTMRSDIPTDNADQEKCTLIQPGELRIGVSEALGTGWLTPRLMDLQSKQPELTLSLFCESDMEIDRSAELDIGIVWRAPKNRDLIMSKLATVHFMPFASRDYIKKFGVPSSIDDLRNHRFIEQAAPGVKSDLLDQLVGSERPAGFLPIRTNSSIALFWAVSNDAGIAFMPTYATAITRKLVPIDLPFQLKFDLFYYYHPEARADGPVQKAVAWLKEQFDPATYPWFRSDFVHPRDFMIHQTEENVVRLFEPLVGKRAL